MDARIVALVLVVAITSGLCTTPKNIFDVKYTKEIGDHLREVTFREMNLDPELVADWLAKSKNKSYKVASGITIKDLLRLAEFDRQSAKDCTQSRVNESRRICSAVRKDNNYLEYCNYCVEKLFQHCAALGYHKEFEGFGRAIFGDLGNPNDNIFGIKYVDSTNFGQRLSYRTNKDFNPKRVAQDLAESGDKWLEVAPDVSINVLLRLAEIDRHSAKDCTRQRVDKSIEICKQVKGTSYDANLLEYCNYCVERLMEHCSAKGYYELFKGFGRAIFNEPGEPKENIFGVEYEDLDTFERVLDGYDHDVKDFKDLADVMAKSSDKSSDISPGVSLSVLLRVAEFDRQSTRDCYRERVVKSREICNTVQADKFRYWLDYPKYCNYCVDQLIQHCAAMGVRNLE